MWGVKQTELEDEAGDDELSHDSEEEEEELRDCEPLYHGQTFKIQEFRRTYDITIIPWKKDKLKMTSALARVFFRVFL